MKNHQKNHNLFDYQTIVVKKDKLTEVINSYQSFGWNVLKTSDHSQYQNLLEVEFYRDHFINNKDDLQFLQVNMEADINKRGKLERHKHSKSLILGLTSGLVACGVVVVSVFSFINSALAFAIMLAVLALTIFAISTVGIVKTFKAEKISFAQTDAQLASSIATSVYKAEKLSGGQHE